MKETSLLDLLLIVSVQQVLLDVRRMVAVMVEEVVDIVVVKVM